MRITLQIENFDRLETGGQLSYSCTARGFDIGRHEHLDWSLPDPNRVISGKHCEVRFEGGQFVLYDFSTNGTFLNGGQTRMDKAHVLRSGDRVMIGDYIILVSLEAASGQEHPAFAHAASAPPAAESWSAAPVGAGPAWPSTPAPAPHAPGPHASGPHQPAPYPSEPAAGPWASPGPGMEGRHAPPTSDPGIGTPADDVWSQQGHGWGSADPALYDPQVHQPDREPARPVQADPLDHLAQQPHLFQDPVAAPPSGLSAAAPDTPFPPVSGETAGGAAEPMFQMPDLVPPEGNPVPQPFAEPAIAALPEQPAASPFPEAPAWPAPEPEVAAVPAPRPDAEPVPDAAGNEAVTDPVQPPVAAAEKTQAAAVGVPVEAEQPAESTGQAQINADAVDFIAAFAEGAGIPVEALKGRDQEEFARELGGILQGITGDLMGLLQARSQVKAMTRNVNRTLIMRSGNNALKFSPTPQVALQTMLSHSAEETGYLPITKAMSEAFKDIQKHHVWTYAAMQKAAARFDETLSPKAVEAEGQVSKSAFGGQKAKHWDRLQERWTSLTQSYDDGLVGVFTQYFTESYEEMSDDEPGQMSGRFE
ncbi:MAG: type VI secretion system-associated FHA domain protein TagH [Roseibium sp.]|uniref:type VI secretion system-associated FHA domain protein TagH n=1 Tax=Roseibium sp. TaxID=1936156 RepID=UPI0032990449